MREHLNSMIGQPAVTLSNLARVGYVKINNKVYDALSSFGTIGKGTRVIVIGVKTWQLVVTTVDNPLSH